MNNPIYLTPEGADQLSIELAQLEGPMREDLARRLKDAISQGDLSENADYHKAKEDQSFLEGRIAELKYTLKNAIIVEKQAGKSDTVEIGVQVTVRLEDDDPITYQLVGAKEANPRLGKISNESPIGKAILGQPEGAVVKADTPGGQVRIKILKIG